MMRLSAPIVSRQACRRTGAMQQANPQISVIVGGNENLEPETSKSWVFGGVYSPSFLPRFSIEVN